MRTFKEYFKDPVDFYGESGSYWLIDGSYTKEEAKKAFEEEIEETIDIEEIFPSLVKFGFNEYSDEGKPTWYFSAELKTGQKVWVIEL